MSSPTRLPAESEETNPLLRSSTDEQHDHDHDHVASSSSPSRDRRGSASSSGWQFWKNPPFVRPRVHFADEEEVVEGEEEEVNGNGVQVKHLHHHHHHHDHATRYGQWILYGALVLLGIVVGTVFSREWQKRTEQTGDGPMVPPVWTLPPPTGLPRNPAYLINATTAAVASEDVTCSNLGLSILKNLNGSAVDAAITTTLCIGLLNAFSSGIGGGGFMVVNIPEDHKVKLPEEVVFEKGEPKVVAIDFRETSPAQSEKEMYGSEKAGRVAAQVGGLAVGVPGELRGLEMAHKMYGTLPWKDLVMPVAELARGWQVSRELARRLRVFGAFMLDSPTWSAVYAPRGSLLVEGDFVQRLNYGKTLEIIAEHGADAFYSGDIADSSVKTIARAGGVLSLDDLKDFKARSYPAIHSSFMGKEIYTTDAPSSGGVLLGLLNILEPYRIPFTGGLTDPLNSHRLIEAMKFAFGARSEITDPAFARDSSRFKDFYSKAWADEIREKITDNQTHGPDYYGVQHDTPVDHGTTHLSVMDKWGGAASVTSTVNLIWGSHVMDPRTGVIFNDEQDDFAVPGAPDAFGLMPSPWNYPAPGKKPLSSTSATIILTPPSSRSASSTLYAVLGGSGGSRIFPSVAQVILNLFSGLDISESIERVRVHNQVVPDLTTIEVGPEGVDEDLIKGLEERGQKIGQFDINLGISEVQAIVVQDGTIHAASDSRKNGIAAGY
ncbi:gamma-glutamyltransferase [Kwoniella shandongensis]|uniref:Glutathione hydrolase n=1 Tax=Kwoniella shandongensis TaxID=1734106 RepID=A0A5M6C731_9TREE|nr:gamma-glutamyltransferase [Kwoniella shandongensis]KAA5528979.1 gamma-glutamyltransferase [Kwoniella shandongensis]